MTNKTSICKKDINSLYSKRRTIFYTKIICTLLINIILVCCSNNRNYKVFLYINTILDIVVCWFLIFYYNIYIKPVGKINKYNNMLCDTKIGIVEEIGKELENINGLYCILLVVNNEKVYLPEILKFNVNVNDQIKITINNNIITEISYENN